MNMFLNFMIQKRVFNKLVALICAAILIIIGIATFLESSVHKSQELADHKVFPDQHLHFGLLRNDSSDHDNYKSSTNLYIFKTDTHVNDTPKVLQEEAGNVSVSNVMLLQIADDCNGRVHWLLDTYVAGHDPDRAKHTIPGGAKFQVRKSGIPGAGLGVWTLEEIPACTMIGPYGGVKKYGADILKKDWIYGWLVLDDVGTPKYVIDAEDPSQSNWLRYINCAKSEETQNVRPFAYLGEQFYYTRYNIKAGTELFVWYGEIYAESLGLL